MSKLIEPASLEELDQLIASNERVLVEFGAAWCAPCRRFLPHFENIADRADVVCVKVDVDSDERIPTAYDIQSVPQVFLFEDGGMIKKTITGRTAPTVLKEIGE